MYCCYRTERRRFKRLRVSLSAIYKIEGPKHVKDILDGREFEAETLDLSEGGVSLHASHYLPEDTEITIKLIILEASNSGYASFYNPVTVKGQVRSVFPLSEEEYRLGIEFKDIEKEIKGKIEDIMYSPLKMPEFAAN